MPSVYYDCKVMPAQIINYCIEDEANTFTHTTSQLTFYGGCFRPVSMVEGGFIELLNYYESCCHYTK